ncbi:MAG: pantetheine-phosphate adenylyltransferase [Acidimicrobiia bacterium]|nr:pantetheine-phosphate adenylyltransferase [Acidimicrobiia bacterium]
MPTALVPGSFDPIHVGHVDVIASAARLFDRVVVAAVGNPQKGAGGLFDLAEREQLIAASVAHLPNVEAASWSGLVVDLARKLSAPVIVKGLRGVTDFEYEVQMAQTNQHLTGVVTMFLPTAPQHGYLASRFIREIARMGGTVDDMVPPPVAARMQELFRS